MDPGAFRLPPEPDRGAAIGPDGRSPKPGASCCRSAPNKTSEDPQGDEPDLHLKLAKRALARALGSGCGAADHLREAIALELEMALVTELGCQLAPERAEAAGSLIHFLSAVRSTGETAPGLCGPER